MANYNIGFISTRFAGTDGVSLETAKWAKILESQGHKNFYFAGLCDRPDEVSRVYPEAFYRHPDILERHKNFFGQTSRSKEDTQWIHEKREALRLEIHKFIEEFSIDLLIPQNCLAIPVNIPLGLALSEVIAETAMPTIAHHHDFIWERKRFLLNACNDYTDMAFPPNLPSVQHVVINSIAQHDLASKKGVASTIVPNVMNFDEQPVLSDEKALSLRKKLNIPEDELFILQPTRIVQRKGMEHAIELVSRLGRKAHLVISHASGDEGDTYAERIIQYAELMNVNLVFASDYISEEKDSEYSLADVFHASDFVTYPSAYEGFGNAFLEGVFFKKPMLVQHYTVYTTDIAPLGFGMVDFDEFITNDTIEEVKLLLDNPGLRREQVERNFELARKYFSYKTVDYKLKALIQNAFGA